MSEEVYRQGIKACCNLCDTTKDPDYRRLARMTAERINSSFSGYCKKHNCEEARKSI